MADLQEFDLAPAALRDGELKALFVGEGRILAAAGVNRDTDMICIEALLALNQCQVPKKRARKYAGPRGWMLRGRWPGHEQ